MMMAEGKEEVCLFVEAEYKQGDSIAFQSNTEHVYINIDSAIAPAQVYLPQKQFVFKLPLDEAEVSPLAVYPPYAFRGDKHLISMRPVKTNCYRNIAQNSIDQRGDTLAFPHVTANVETRDESVFAARNVIDGTIIANGHGEWPYGSWGIGARTDAFITLEFGRLVEIDKTILYLRADFPHDAYWVRGTVELSDGFEKIFELKKVNGAQEVALGIHNVTWIRLKNLIKCDMPSAFPALRQWEVYGKNSELEC